MANGNKGQNKGIANLKPCKKGETHNPSGRPKIPEDIKKAFKELTPKAIETIEHILDDPSAKPSDRLRAAEYVIDRAYGKPVQTNEVSLDSAYGVIMMPEVAND